MELNLFYFIKIIITSHIYLPYAHAHVYTSISSHDVQNHYNIKHHHILLNVD